MTSVGRRPMLHELLEALHAIDAVEADAGALNPDEETFRVILTFTRARCPEDWRDGQPKPTWLFEQIIEELTAWELQRLREEQWVSKEERMGSSIDTLMAHCAEELKKVSTATPQTLHTQFQTRILADTILRLKELKERRDVGAVYSRTERRREQARKAWEEEETEGLKREEDQQRQHSRMNYGLDAFFTAEERRAYRSLFEDHFSYRPSPPKSSSKRAWHEVLWAAVTATKAEITKAYRQLVAKYHPDRYK